MPKQPNQQQNQNKVQQKQQRQQQEAPAQSVTQNSGNAEEQGNNVNHSNSIKMC